MSGGRRRRDRRERVSSLTAFGDVLRRTAKSLGLEPAVRLVDAREAWESIVGSSLAKASRVVSFRGGVLVVSAEHPLVAQEIRMRRGEILAALGRHAGTPPVRLQVIIRPKGQSGGNAH